MRSLHASRAARPGRAPRAPRSLRPSRVSRLPRSSRPRRALLASAIGVALAVPLVLPQAAAAGPAALPHGGAAPEAAARTGGVQSLALRPLETDTRGGGETAAPLGAQGLPSTDTEPFSLVGVVWTDPAAELHGTVEVRTRQAGTTTWSDWQSLDAQATHAPDPGSSETGGTALRGGTAPLWVGPSDGVQARVVPEEGDQAAPLPEGLSLELVDPGEAPAQEAAEDDDGDEGDGSGEEGEAEQRSGAAQAGEFEGPRPPIVIRSGWGADEGLRESGFVYTDTVKTVFVHHTAGSNNYSCSEAPSLIRSIYRYHVESQGWRDVGYNFFVDKCGTIYEGRAGGVAEPVQGAHTLGFNHNSSGVAVLGTHSSTAPSSDVRDALSLLTAWKLGLHDGNPSGTRNRTSSGGSYASGTTIRLNNISGHRDGYATDCPGDQLYGLLPAVRKRASELQGR
ncbi:peptidoglycan recognition protein [Streptomyces sp. DSM 44917]|uniref:Peptidoglycan recognition protein n=1 Tax=Streptomyces boetiae TaxID=3075541 RepID=A0ABU2LFK9_9ACTN|nr:peptidoglycan recognition protein [Streptomyces sp. DSM 44917]MDT0310245.1 peptidoglycan recognition protein [Streptomyces sp. DSM 44917]